MNASDCIKPIPRNYSPAEIYRIQSDLMRFCRPYNRLISDIYLLSPFKLLLSPDGQLCEIIYPPDVEARAAEIRQLRDETVRSLIPDDLHERAEALKSALPPVRTSPEIPDSSHI